MSFDPTRNMAYESQRVKHRTRSIRQQQPEFSLQGITALAIGSMIGSVAGEFAIRRVYGTK